MQFDLQTLIDKLNPVCRKALELAAELCLTQTNYNVEIEHLLLKLLDLPETDLQRLLRYYEIRTADVASELTRAIETFKRGNSRTPALSPHIVRLLEQAWMMSSLHLGQVKIRSGAIFLALLDHDALRGIILESCKSLRAVPREVLLKDLPEIIQASDEDGEAVSAPDGRKDVRHPSESGQTSSKTPALDQYTIDLTARARSGQIDPVQCREFEIRQIIDILTRRRQNNPILTGEAGVGKTAVVEGFAIRIARGDVPPSVKNISLRLLDLGLLQAGAGIKGEFEKRLKSVIEEVKSSPHPIILFIDEAHTMIGAGGPAGMGDAANLLKPALARGELRTIAATTWSEYKKYFEK
ncbi:MAG: AAA family ATPase, partial [Deltaproteobacteria bacterium]|nr:AAA family ATPase [Deltaproteobacteria bacterium]